MFEETFKNKKLNTQKLCPFGFEPKKNCYEYSAPLAGGALTLTVYIHGDGKINTLVTDAETGDEYVLYRNPDACGSFVGQVKEEYSALLASIEKNCFETDFFRSACARKIVEYSREKYGDELEFLWTKFSDNAVLRRKDTQKWYAVLMAVSKSKLGVESTERTEIIDLRIKPENMQSLVDNKKYFPGYHMNKKHWLTICLDGSVSPEEICRRIDESYSLAAK